MSKQAIVFVVDLGSTTAECHNGRVETDLDFEMKYVWNKIGYTMSENKTTSGVGVVGFRTEETNNTLGEGYEHISVLKELGPMELSQLVDLRSKIVSSDEESGDAISAICVAIAMIDKFTLLKSGKPGKYERKIALLTDGQGAIDDDDIDRITKKINESEIELLVIGVDFDDPEFGFTEEDKFSEKRDNERILKTLAEGCVGSTFATAAEVIESIVANPVVKVPRPYSNYKGKLVLGDPEKYPETALVIDVERYFKTHIAKPVSAGSYISRTSNGNGEGSAQSSHTVDGNIDMTDVPTASDGLSAVRSAFTYKVNDPSAPGGKRDVDREELEKGFEYGRTAVPMNEGDYREAKLPTVKSFSIIGFVPSIEYERFLNMGECGITIAQSINDKARLGFSSLVHALWELESYAIARLVKKDGADPIMLCLAPSIDKENGGLESLLDVPLPFAEDYRVYRFPPLDRVITVSGNTLTTHRYLPTDNLVKAMSDFVDSMDLTSFQPDDASAPTEYMSIDETYSPMVHRIRQAIEDRAINPTEPVKPPSDILMKWSHPPERLVSQAAPQLETLVNIAHVQKVPPKTKGKRNGRDPIKPLSGLDVASLLNRENRQRISVGNAIPEFKQMLANTTDDNTVIDAANQMSEIIRRLVTESIGEKNYAQALENLKVLRREVVDFEMPDVYNDFLRDFKKRLVAEQLGGDRRAFWFALKMSKLGLIDKFALEISEISEEDAKEFYLLTSGLPTRGRS